MKHFAASIEAALESRNFYAALAVALAAPDICGWVATPNAGSRARYVAWFERFMQSHYVRPSSRVVPEHTFLTGNDCYALRCAFLHKGRDDITDQRAQQALESFQFVVAPAGWTIHMNQANSMLQLQVDIFCRQIADGIREFVDSISEDAAATARAQQLMLIRDVNGNPVA
jgi:hypothetical protein